MDTVLAIGPGKNKSVFCKLDRSSLKTQYHKVRTRPEVFRDLFAKLDIKDSIVPHEVGNQAS